MFQNELTALNSNFKITIHLIYHNKKKQIRTKFKMNNNQLKKIDKILTSEIDESSQNLLLIEKELHNHINNRDMIINAIKALNIKICII